MYLRCTVYWCCVTVAVIAVAVAVAVAAVAIIDKDSNVRSFSGTTALSSGNFDQKTEKRFPLDKTRHFHPDHHDPDDREQRKKSRE
uniref:Uncharacterized protein n=1 Tax=Vespula pensylvanica TaxID=30213 RepID=A0A834JJY3_VESPE|nr:hypothetical protein H0235_017909 [Vespula pensylvanica]